MGEVQSYVGATHDCPYCGVTVIINENLTVSDFGTRLVDSYNSMGLKVTKEEALGGFL